MISISYIAWYAKTCQAKKIEPLGWTHYIWSKCVFWGICVKFWSHRTTVNDDAAAQQISASPLVLRFHSHSLEVCPIDVVQGEGCMRWDLVDEKNLNFLREGAFFHTSLLVNYFVLIWKQEMKDQFPQKWLKSLQWKRENSDIVMKWKIVGEVKIGP